MNFNIVQDCAWHSESFGSSVKNAADQMQFTDFFSFCVKKQVKNRNI